MSDGAEHLRLVDPPPEPPPDPLLGQTIDGRYKVEKMLGQGGMGIVYKAQHVILQKALAVKVLRADVSKDQEIMSRFRQEAQSASAIGSQHIIDISDFGQLPDGSTYFVMEFLGGRELTKVIESDRPIPPERVVDIGSQLCDALGAAHDRGIVHRDMKPDNVFLIKRGGSDDFVKVLDFGIAKVGGASSKLTKAGQVFGTPHYMSPEQCAGQGVDHRTDIYALGVILYELACGKVPFDADNLMGILTKHIYEKPIPLHQLPPPVEVPPGLEAVILRCLEKSPDHRYQTMAEVKADLSAFAAGRTPNAVVNAVDRTTGARIDPTGQLSALQVEVGRAGEPPPSKMPMILGAVVGLVALAGVALAVYFVVLAPEPPPPEPIAQVVTAPEPEPEVIPDPEPEVAPLPPPAPDAVTITVVSEPAGVEVWMQDEGGEGTLLGNTPFVLEQPARGARVDLTLRQPGYADSPVRLGHMTNGEVRVQLRRASGGGRHGSSGHSSSGHSSSGHSSSSSSETAQQNQQQQQPQQEQPAGGQQPSGIGGSEVLDPWARPARTATPAP
jgi:serine/threonine-protein kinase